MAKDAEDPGLWGHDACFLLEAEAIRPGNERPEQQLIVDQDDPEHGADRPAHRGEVLLRYGQGM